MDVADSSVKFDPKFDDNEFSGTFACHILLPYTQEGEGAGGKETKTPATFTADNGSRGLVDGALRPSIRPYMSQIANDILRPLPNMTSLVETFWKEKVSNVKQKVLGVHVRTTDYYDLGPWPQIDLETWLDSTELLFEEKDSTRMRN